MSGLTAPPVAYFWGEDAYAIERAVRDLAAVLGEPGPPLEIWRSGGDDAAAEGATGRSSTDRTLDLIAEAVGTGRLFGGGTLVVVSQPAGLLRSNAGRERLTRLPSAIAAGNGLCFTELIEAGRETATGGELRRAVAEAGARVAEFRVPTRDAMERQIVSRGEELGVTFAPGAARMVAERVGAFVRETDIDRRRQSQLAMGEVEKLALLRFGGRVEREDVAELVPEAVPGSTWGLLDAVGYRRAAVASGSADRLLRDGAPLPVLIAQLHRRIRELIGVGDELAAGTQPAELPRLLRLQPYRAQKLVEQARTWGAGELEAALNGLLDLDLESKGVAREGATRPLSDEGAAVVLQAWIAERVARPG
jgi:DNA polymerase III delta subunit